MGLEETNYLLDVSSGEEEKRKSLMGGKQFVMFLFDK